MFDPERLLAAVCEVPAECWQKPSNIATNAVHHLYGRAKLVVGGEPQSSAPLFQWVFDGFDWPVIYAAVTRLEPGGFILPHRDMGPYYERWQVPITDAGMWGDGTTRAPGVPHRVEQWLPHSVWNTSDAARLVLLVDLDRVVRESEPFELYPVPPELQAVVDAATATQ